MSIVKHKRVVTAVQDYKKYGYSETVHTDKGMIIVFDEDKNLERDLFEAIIGDDFGKKDLILPANSYGNLIQRVEEELRSMLRNQKRVPTERYDDMREILGEQYVVNLRKDKDKELSSFNRFYLNLKSYYDKGYPLYLSIATPEDVKKHFGNFKVGDHYEPLSNQSGASLP